MPLGFRSFFPAAVLLGRVAVISLGLGGEASSQQALPAAAAGGQILAMSDLHFDPMADPRLVDRLAVAEPDGWSAILDNSSDRGFSQYGRDTNWPLLHSALRQMAETLPNPVFVLISGDFLAHHFREEFDAAASDRSDAAYRGFVRKTMEFLGQQLEQGFRGTPIIPALGNNDEICGDYQLQPGGPFLADTLPIIRGLVGNAGGPSLDRDWQSHGNYSARVGGVRVLSTNTNFFSVRYRNTCGSPADGDPGKATLAWLEAELAAAKVAQERVWLLYHIPPGIDGYATLRRGSCPGPVVPMWEQAHAEAFIALLRRYSDIVIASFAGHTHMDDFRLIGDTGGRFAFALMTPAVSPIFGQNPAFRTVSYDAAAGITDQTTYALANLADATVAPGGIPPEWRAEYTFTTQWSLPRIDLPSIDRLYSLITEVPEAAQRWHVIFPVSSPVYWAPFSTGSEKLAQAVRAFRCASGNIDPNDYEHCNCSNHD
ncbi:MAG: metallophosphoesterase [Alphaproteobacteria bacterium]|nr:metallophosphoesterase [Alphaproteobacteria bacterium]